MAARVDDDARWNLAGRNLAIHRADATEKIRLDDAAAVVDILVTGSASTWRMWASAACLEARIDEVCCGSA